MRGFRKFGIGALALLGGILAMRWGYLTGEQYLTLTGYVFGLFAVANQAERNGNADT